MTLAEKDRDTLIKYRIERAKETINEVKFLIDNNMYKLAISRIYYGNFYIVSALALIHKFSTKIINN